MVIEHWFGYHFPVADLSVLTKITIWSSEESSGLSCEDTYIPVGFNVVFKRGKLSSNAFTNGNL